MNVALYFGSFNPLHFGHLGIAEFVEKQPDVEQVRLIVSPKNPLKSENILSDPHQRLSEINTVIRNTCMDNIVVSDIEFHLPNPLYTYNTLVYLQENEPENNFILIIGADNLAIFDKWYNWQKLLLEFDVWVYPRQGFDINKIVDYYMNINKEFRIKILEAPLYHISSTEIREQNQSKPQ